MSLPANQEIQRLQPDTLVNLYVLDATALTGGGLFRFYPGTDQNQQPVVWQGVEYAPFPCEVKGFEYSGQGSPPRPSLMLANVGGMISSLLFNFEDLIGAKVVRKRTFAKFLDGQPQASPTTFLPDEVYFVERKVSETKFMVELELTTSMELDDVALPRRRVVANLCAWQYRSGECGWAGNGVTADRDDNPLGPGTDRGQWSAATTYHTNDFVWLMAGGVRRYFICRDDNGTGIAGEEFGPQNSTHWTPDECSRRIRGCTLRFHDHPLGLPFGGFPAAGRNK